MGTGGAALIVGGVMQGLSGSAQNRAEQTNRFSVFESESDKMALFQNVAIAGFAAGGLLLGTGLTLFMISKRTEREEESAVVTVTPSPTGLIIGGRF